MNRNKTFRKRIPATGRRILTTDYRLLTTGFTLMELLIAIGILAIGAAMAAALFPAAIKESQRANNSVLGLIICENGLNTATLLALHHDAATPPFGTAELTNGTSHFGKAELAFPEPTTPQPTAGFDKDDYPDWKQITIAGSPEIIPETPYGFLVLGKNASTSGTDNDYQLAIISYNRKEEDDNGDDNGLPYLEQVTFSSTAGSQSFTVGTGEGVHLRLGSPLIHASTGRFASIMSINGDSGTLDKPVAIDNITTEHGWVVKDPNDDIRSPALRVYLDRTPLLAP